MFRKLISTLCFAFMACLLSAQTTVNVNGVVYFGIEGEQLAPGVSVDLLLENIVVESTTTNDEGAYELSTTQTIGDWATFAVAMLDVCTGDYNVIELAVQEVSNDFEINLVVCGGIFPPPPPDGCEAYFYSEQIQTDAGFQVAFFDISYSDDPIEGWLWTLGDEVVSTEQNPTLDFTLPGEYEVTLTISSEDCTHSVTQIVIVIDEGECDCDETEIEPVCVATPSGTILNFPNACFAECAGYGMDVYYPCDGCFCDDVWDPVCVEIGPIGIVITFNNPCQAACEGFTEEDFVECEDDCGCDTVYDPICVNGFAGQITFSNPCLALCAGFTEDMFVTCDNGCDVIDCSDEWDPVCVVAEDGTIITFENACYAICGGGYSEEDFVECDIDCNADCAAFFGPPVCVLTPDGEILHFINACYAECAGYGLDTYIPCEDECDCPTDEWDPVCVNGFAGQITFSNACFALCEGFTEADFVTCDDECSCPENWDPVCVTDPATGEVITFSNACFAECEGYGPDEYGPCEDECGCDEIYDPVCVLLPVCDYLTFDNACLALCAGFTEEMFVECEPNCDCPDVWDPVCIDTPMGIFTFPNACQAQCLGFMEEDFVECENDCETECEAFFGPPVCVLTADGEILHFQNACYAACEGYGPDTHVDCEDECNCPDVWDPVCVNGFAGQMTFSNACEALCLGFTEEMFVECEDDCICPDVWDPVCVNGDAGPITYGNACEAICAGFTEEDFIECENGCDCDAFFGPPVCVLTPDGEIIHFLNACYAECEGYGPDTYVDCEDDCNCPDVWDPVCINGFDGQIVFPNACEALCAGFTEDMLIDCEDGCVCTDEWDPVCVTSIGGTIIQFGNPCEAMCEGYTEADFIDCEDECICPEIYDPVCVMNADGTITTFDNACFAECEGYGPDTYVPCDDECICPQVFDPVCVIDPTTGDVIEFINACYAECEGYADHFPCDDVPPTCIADFTAGFTTTNGLDVQFTDHSYASDAITSWTWNFGDGNESDEQHPQHSYQEAGVYDVALIITSGECTSTYVHHLLVGEDGGTGGPDCQAMFFFSQPDPANLLTFDFLDVSLGISSNWLWDFGDGTTSTEQNPTHTYEVAGQYVVSLSINDGECASSIQMLIAADTNIWYGNGECQAWFLPIVDQSDNSVFFVNLSSPDIVEFDWNFGDGNTSNDAFAFHTYDEAGSYTVTLTTTNEEGCISEFTVTLNIGNGDGDFGGGPVFSLVNDTDDLLDEATIIVSPNPTTGNATISWESKQTGEYSWMLYDVNGRLLTTKTLQSKDQLEQIHLDLSNYQSGIYLFRLQTPQGTRTLKLSKI